MTKNFAKRWSVLSKLLSVAKRLRKLSSQTLAEKWRENEHKVDSLLCRFFPSVGLQKRDSVYDQDDSELPDEWYLDSLVVSPKYRGCGIGTALLKALPKVAHKRNKARIGLDVDVKNTKAEHLYRHLGFKGSSTCLIDAHEYKHLQIAV